MSMDDPAVSQPGSAGDLRPPTGSSSHYAVQSTSEPNGVRVVGGPRVARTLAAQVALWTEAARCSREPECRSVLVIDAMHGAPQLHEVRTLVQDVLVRGWGKAKLAWLLLEPSPGGRASVAEVWTRLEGVNARAFFSEAAAREWIEAD